MRRQEHTIRDVQASAARRISIHASACLAAVIALVFAAPRASAQTPTSPSFVGFRGGVSYTNINAGSLSGNPPVPANQMSVAVGHFRHSSASSKVLDLAVADAANETVEIWFGNGDGTFQRPAGSEIYTLPNLTSLYPSAPSVPAAISTTGNTQIAAADLTSDTGASGYDDIVLANYPAPGTIVVLQNKRDGSGTFTVSLIPSEVNNLNYVTNQGGSVAIAIGDFNGDGIPDLAVGNIDGNYGGDIDVVLNNCSGGGAFSFCAPVSYNAGIRITGIAAAPLQKSNTGNEDIVATDGANVYVLLNGLKGDGNFPCAASSTYTCQTVAVSATYNNAISGLIAVNLNNGSSPDVVVEDQYGDPAVLLNNGSGTLTPQAGSPLPVNYAATAGLFGFSGSSSLYPGLVLLAGGGMVFLPNTTSTPGGSVSFGAPIVIGPYTERFDIGAAIATGDLNGDGNPDVVAVEGSELHVVLGNGDGTFQTAPRYLESAADPAEITSNASTMIVAVAVGNLHGTTNGAMDTVSADVGEANTDYPGPVSSLIVRLANPDGTLQTGTVILQVQETTGEFNSIVLGNYGGKGFQPGGNGAMDIAAVTNIGDIYILQNDGDGNFTQAGKSPLETGLQSLAGAVAGDFAGHGSPTDIAAIGPVANPYNYSGVPQSGSVIVFSGNGDGTFAPFVEYQGTQNTTASSLTTFVNPAQLAVGSLGSSTYPDIVVADSGEIYATPAGGGVWVLRNQGSGTFGNPQQVSATSATCCGGLTAGPSSIGLGHLFGSPYLDIVAATVPNAAQFLEVLQNSGNYSFPIPSTAVSVYPYGGEVALADVNGDNAPDVLLFSGDAVQALLNTSPYPPAFASSGILLPWDPEFTTGPSSITAATSGLPPLFGVGYSANSPTIPDVAAGDAQPAVDLLLNGANGSGTSPLEISPATLPAGIVGTAYSQTLTASGGSGSGYSFTVTAGTGLSATGLILSPAGVISGTPATAETSAEFTVQVTDSSGDTAAQDYALTVNPALQISPSTLPEGTAGVAYSQALTASGGSGTGYTWSVTAGAASLSSLGLSLSANTIEGSHPAVGTASFTVQVQDSNGDLATMSYTLTIHAAPAPVQVSDPETIAVSDAMTSVMNLDVGDPETVTVTDIPVITISGGYTIGGTLSGLATGTSVTLLDNGAGALTLSKNGPFTFTVPLTSSETYNVTVLMQPADQICSVSGGTGTVSTANVTSVSVSCIAAATLSLTAAPATTTVNGSITLTATVTPPSGSVHTPSGNFNFSFGGASLTGCASVPLNPGGAADCTTDNLPKGQDTVTASYSGDPNFTASSPATFTVNVTAASATMTLAASPQSIAIGGSVILTANVTPSVTGPIAPSGSVNFTLSGVSLPGCSSIPVSSTSGNAVCTSTTLPPGSDTITATYFGDPNFTVATPATTSVNVGPANTTTTLTTSGQLSPEGYDLTLTASVASAAAGTPGGTITFYDGTTALGTVTLQNASASLATNTLPEGSNTLTAVYNGDNDFLGSTSVAVVETISGFNLSFSSSGMLTLLPGQTITLTVTVTPQYGSYADPITLSLSGLPAGATYTFSPGSVTPGSSTITTTITITIPPASSQSQPPAIFRDTGPVLLAILMPAAAFCRRRRKLRSILLALIAFCALGALAGLSSCSSSGFFNQPPQTYTITVTGSSGAAQHSTTLTVTVE
jgi:hypothetical protein